MKIHNTVALVTGANRGIGLAFTRELLARGARKVYGGARDPASVTLPGVQSLTSCAAHSMGSRPGSTK